LILDYRLRFNWWIERGKIIKLGFSIGQTRDDESAKTQQQPLEVLSILFYFSSTVQIRMNTIHSVSHEIKYV